MKQVLFVFVAVLGIGCAKQPSPESAAQVSEKPSAVVLKFWDAVNRADSNAYMTYAAEGRRTSFASRPGSWSRFATFWKQNHAKVDVISEHEDSSVAYVTIHTTITGRNPWDTTQTIQLYRENGQWKYGW